MDPARRPRTPRDILPALALTLIAGWLLAVGVRDGQAIWRLGMTGFGFLIFAAITFVVTRSVWRDRGAAADDRR